MFASANSTGTAVLVKINLYNQIVSSYFTPLSILLINYFLLIQCLYVVSVLRRYSEVTEIVSVVCLLDCVPISRLLWSLSCLEYRLRDVVCEYDSTVAFKLILEETSKFHPHATLINSINQVSGEGNVCANWLAN